jgi:hypothetical protein
VGSPEEAALAELQAQLRCCALRGATGLQQQQQQGGEVVRGTTVIAQLQQQLQDLQVTADCTTLGADQGTSGLVLKDSTS